MKIIKNILRAIKLAHKRILFRIAKVIHKPTDKIVFFESFQGRNYSCSPKAMFEEMRDSGEYGDYEFIWAFRHGWGLRSTVKKLMDNKGISNGTKITIVRYESFAYYRALARAKYWVLNSNTRKFVKPAKDQIYIQTWHGTPLKKIGLDVPGSDLDYGKESQKFSYMISPSKYCTEKYISAFGLQGREDIVLETGYPRNDALFTFDEAKVNSILRELDIPRGKKIILYAPTFRDNKHSQVSGYENASGVDFEKLQEAIGNEYVVLFRAHYFVAKNMDFEKYKDFVFDVSNYEDVNDLYIISDMLITDYSSVFFDYANLKRPIIFYMYDYEDYKENARDFYLNQNELPGPIAKTQDELVKAIEETRFFIPDARYSMFNQKFNHLDGINCGLNVARKVIK
ncbi:MAG: CDP-glycerol glycerophosphotransferase family protein [Eubacterium sp.]|nr:CDP-glycerol glycerophosphotransferase family protein [Eubacterium sp.]